MYASLMCVCAGAGGVIEGNIHTPDSAHLLEKRVTTERKKRTAALRDTDVIAAYDAGDPARTGDAGAAGCGKRGRMMAVQRMPSQTMLIRSRTIRKPMRWARRLKGVSCMLACPSDARADLARAVDPGADCDQAARPHQLRPVTPCLLGRMVCPAVVVFQRGEMLLDELAGHGECPESGGWLGLVAAAGQERANPWRATEWRGARVAMRHGVLPDMQSAGWRSNIAGGSKMGATPTEPPYTVLDRRGPGLATIADRCAGTMRLWARTYRRGGRPLASGGPR